jgi:two-component system, cell cycle sensor histidine kinase and response regulator CckA
MWISWLAQHGGYLGFAALSFAVFGAVDWVRRRRTRRAEAALRESEARLRTIFDNLPFSFWVVDRSGRCVLHNEHAAEWRGPFLGKTPDELAITPAQRAEFAETDRQAMAGHVVHRPTVEVRADGRKRHGFKVVAPIRVENQITGALGIELDITDRVEAEQARRESEAKLALHVAQTPLAVVEWDLNHEIRGWNPAAERIFGYTASEAIGRDGVTLLVPEPARPAALEMWWSLLAQQDHVRCTLENRTKDGRAITCEWYHTPLIAEDGAVVGVASHAQDITERVTLERHLRQTQKMESLGQIAGGVAHEFNNLLTPMLVQVSLIQEMRQSDEELTAMLRPIRDAIRQAADLNQRILAVGRRASDQRELLALNPLVENAVGLLRHTLDRRIELIVELGNDLGLISLTRSAVSQIVMNLALNARYALLARLKEDPPSDWSPELTVRTSRCVAMPTIVGRNRRKAQPCACLSVEDNGTGMSDEVRQRIFDPFFTTKPAGQGTGLGLAVVWNLIDDLGGWIEVESALGAGTRFCVYLPIASPTPTSASEQNVTTLAPERVTLRRPARSHRVMVAEDNPLVAETLTRVLEHAGYSITLANDGEEAWRLINEAEQPVELLLADLNMPRLSGRDLLERMATLTRPCPVIILTGHVTTAQVNELEEFGAAAVLRKPLGMNEVLAEVARAIDRSAAADEVTTG